MTGCKKSPSASSKIYVLVFEEPLCDDGRLKIGTVKQLRKKLETVDYAIISSTLSMDAIRTATSL